MGNKFSSAWAINSTFQNVRHSQGNQIQQKDAYFHDYWLKLQFKSKLSAPIDYS